MLDEIIVKHCAPTLAGLKTGNLFAYEYENNKELDVELHKWNYILNEKGIFIVSIRRKNGRALIYVYRRKQLERELSRKEIIEFLFENGYISESMESCLYCLAKRLEADGAFPHEIGVFLGYPLADIKAFIENKGANCKCTGCWKVYTDEHEARKTFEKYKKCTDVYCNKIAEGIDITRLTIAV